MKISAVIIFFACILSAQGLLDNEILDIELNENLIVVGSKYGVNWRSNGGKWQEFKCEPFAAKDGANLDNIVLGENGFAVRLDLKNDNTVQFLFSDLTSNPPAFSKKEIQISKENPQLFGYDGYYDGGKYFFAMGDGGIAVLEKNQEITKKSADFCVNSVNNKYMLSDDGKIFKDADNIYSIQLEKNELAVKFVKDFSGSSVLILTVDTTVVFGKDNLFRLNESDNKLTPVFNGDISKAAVTPDGFIYILDSEGRLSVLNLDGKSSNEANERKKKLDARFNKVNVSFGYKLTDISVFGDKYKYSIGFASSRGIFYSDDEENGIKKETPFDYFYKAVPLKVGLKEVYAEPGILTAGASDKFCTFEYSLDKKDRVTIDIFNYNLDFVCRITENELRDSVDLNERSTVRSVDRWDGTVNNRGGRPVSPGVYYFKITTQKQKLSAFGKIVVAR